jgi:hypothetical protein
MPFKPTPERGFHEFKLAVPGVSANGTLVPAARAAPARGKPAGPAEAGPPSAYFGAAAGWAGEFTAIASASV